MHFAHEERQQTTKEERLTEWVKVAVAALRFATLVPLKRKKALNLEELKGKLVIAKLRFQKLTNCPEYKLKSVAQLLFSYKPAAGEELEVIDS